MWRSRERTSLNLILTHRVNWISLPGLSNQHNGVFWTSHWVLVKLKYLLAKNFKGLFQALCTSEPLHFTRQIKMFWDFFSKRWLERAMYRTPKEIFLVLKSQRNGKRHTIKKGFPLYSDLQEGTGLELGVPRRWQDTFWPEGVQSQKQAGKQVKNPRRRVRNGEKARTRGRNRAGLRSENKN